MMISGTNEFFDRKGRKSHHPVAPLGHVLEHPVALFVLPVFALTNAGIPMDFKSFSMLSSHFQCCGLIH